VPTYNLKITIPQHLDKVIAAPLVFGRWLWYGYTFRRVKLTKGKHARVDVCNFEQLSRYNWYAVGNSKLYAHRRIYKGVGKKREFVAMHREVIGAPDGMCVDHIDGDSLNNTRANLRIATSEQNAWNKRKFSKGGTSEYMGVHWSKGEKKWRANIGYKNKKIYLGFFEAEKDAAKAYDEAAKKYYGEFAYLNFPERKVKGLRGLFIRLLLRSKAD
jgi:hypothetical protein